MPYGIVSRTLRRELVRRGLFAVAAWSALTFLASHCQGQVDLNAADAVFRSTGYASGSDWVLSGNGYLGTFVHLDNPGTVQFTVNAAGEFAGGEWPLMDLHVANQKASWSVADSGFMDYSATFQLPSGTHNMRVEFLNDYNGGAQADRNLVLGSLSVSGPAAGASVRNSDSAAVIGDAADTYIENHRKGPARIVLKDAGGSPLPPGIPVHVKLRNHAFHFGSAVAGTDRNDGHLLDDNPAPGSDPYNYQQALRQHFNMLQPEKAGGWRWNEQTRGVPTMEYVDMITDFAEQHGMETRMNCLLYGDGLRPDWVRELETRATGGDVAARNDLRSAISSRNDYFVSDRITRYDHLNGINESYHKPLYTDIYGLAGVADIYNEMIDAADAAGADAVVAFNEYGVLGRWAQYGEWYRQHIEDVIEAGITPENRRRLGIGIENYTGSNKHGAHYIHRGLQTMAWFEYPITLTEFGVNTGDAYAPDILLDNMRLVFGSDVTDGFLLWGFWEPRMWQPVTGAALYDSDWNLTESGKVYQQLLGIHDWQLADVPVWTTDLALLTDENGRIDFRGFYGDYDLLIGDTKWAVSIVEGVSDYELTMVPEPSSLTFYVLGSIVLMFATWRRVKCPR